MRADELAYPSAAPSGERAFDEPGAAGSTLRDPLTGLPGPVLLNDRLAQALRRAAYRGESLAVLCLGLDNLALIRERLGHEAGAHLLADSAAACRPACRATARWPASTTRNSPSCSTRPATPPTSARCARGCAR